MSYFTHADHTALSTHTGSLKALPVYEKFWNLHETVRDKIRMNDWDLHPHWRKASIISDASSAAAVKPQDVMVLSYFRPYEQARLVEGLMGIEPADADQDVQTYRHPAIELRIAPEYFSIELVVSPLAWWDQQNFIGKLELGRHRDALRRLLYRLDGDYRFGFWGGENLADMHLTTWQMLHGRVLDEWMDTFADGQDWLRMGIWYEPESSSLSAHYIVQEAITRIGELYSLYDFLLWTGNNNYHDFYHKRDKYARRMYA
ncbi:MAG: hypothetical protein K8J31_31795 [Anaerolineae bacterium]|nr:hypothetical protein [Anaerolineae bacterium]